MSSEIEDLKEKLAKLTATMDVPGYRRDSVKWLVKNLAIRNSSHVNFQAAMEIADKLNKMGVA